MSNLIQRSSLYITEAQKSITHVAALEIKTILFDQYSPKFCNYSSPLFKLKIQLIKEIGHAVPP
jgi:hypothetical protein